MNHRVLPIEVNYAKAGLDMQASPTLHTYILDTGYDGSTKVRRPAVVICPGGGYSMTSDREAEPIAIKFNSLGFHAFVVRYTVTPPMCFPGALLEASRAIAMVREHADEWCVDSDKVFIIGFSAGGHLAGSVGVFWNHDFVKEALGTYNGEHKPNGMILSYPVISSGEYGHHDSIRNLLRERYDEQKEAVSLEKQVSDDTVPAFIWHTVEDTVVPVENALLMASALQAKKIPYELHVYPYGFHGLALSTGETGGGPAECAQWPELVSRWARSL